MAIGGVNMWALLLDKDPGHSAAASDLAVDVVDQKLKKAAAVTVVKAEEAPPSGNASVAKPAKRSDKAKRNKKIAAGDCKLATTATVDAGGELKINVAAGDNRQASAADRECEERTNTWVLRYLSSQEEKRVNRAKAMNTESAAGCSKQAAAAIMDDGAQEQMNGDGERQAEAVADTVPYLVAEDISTQDEGQEFTDVVATRRAVARRVRKATAAGSSTVVAGANMWALLSDEDPGHTATSLVDDRKQRKAAVVAKVEEAPLADDVDDSVTGVRVGQGAGAKPAKRGKKIKTKKKGAARDSKQAPDTVDGAEVQLNGAGDNKQTAVPDGDELTTCEEIEETLAAMLGNETAEEEEAEEDMFEMVASRGAHRRTVAARTSKAAVLAEGVTGTNMWALLSDDDPGQGATTVNDQNHKKRGKKTKKKGNKQTATVDGGGEVRMNGQEETPASELEEELSDTGEEDEMTDKVATGGSRCGTVASRVCRAAVAVALFALYFQLASTPSV